MTKTVIKTNALFSSRWLATLSNLWKNATWSTSWTTLLAKRVIREQVEGRRVLCGQADGWQHGLLYNLLGNCFNVKQINSEKSGKSIYSLKKNQFHVTHKYFSIIFRLRLEKLHFERILFVGNIEAELKEN